jgi:hypothetical protein
MCLKIRCSGLLLLLVVVVLVLVVVVVVLSMRLRIWLRSCATSRKVTGSIPDGVIGIFHSRNFSVALWSTEPLSCLGLTTLIYSCADFHEILAS